MPPLSPITLAVIAIVVVAIAAVLFLSRKRVFGMLTRRAPAGTTTTTTRVATISGGARNRALIHPPRGTFFVVRHGQIERTPPEPGGEHVLAKLTVVRDHAVTLEDAAGQHFGIAIGPKVEDLPFGVEPRLVIITRPRFKRLAIRDLPTKDGRLVERVDFGIQYQIDLEEPEDVEFKTARPKVGALFKAAYHVVLWEEGAENPHPVESWEMAVHEMAKNMIRQEVARRRLEDLFHPDEPVFLYESIENEATVRLQNVISDWGVQVERLQIQGMWPGEEYRRALVQQWEMQKKSQAEAERVRLLERARGEAWRRLLFDVQQGVARKRPNQSLAVRLIEFLKYLDTQVELAHSEDAPPAQLPNAQLEKMMEPDSKSETGAEAMNEVEAKENRVEALEGGVDRPTKEAKSRVA